MIPTLSAVLGTKISFCCKNQTSKVVGRKHNFSRAEIDFFGHFFLIFFLLLEGSVSSTTLTYFYSTKSISECVPQPVGEIRKQKSDQSKIASGPEVG